jgi:adenine-specific DNA methylase
VTLGAILPDPADENCPEEFSKKAQEVLSWRLTRDLSNPYALREALLDFIAGFSSWESSTDQRMINTAQALVAAAYPESPPLVVDPFAGIGSIPLEALRLGCDAFAGELNPVAALLLKAVLEYIPRHGKLLGRVVKEWGDWVRKRAEEELKGFYPPESDGSIPLAYFWARTINCEGPGCGAKVPLVGLTWLSRKKGNLKALKIIPNEEKRVEFEIQSPKSEDEVQPGIVRGFAATCPICGYTTPKNRVKEQLSKQHSGTKDAQLIAVVTLNSKGQRIFRLATERDLEALAKAKEELKCKSEMNKNPFSLVPNETFPYWDTRAFTPGVWGIKTWGDLFNPRQALALSVFSQAVREAHEEMVKRGVDPTFAKAITTCLALAVSGSLLPYLSSLSFYSFDHMRSIFMQGNSIPMRPDFAEANPFMPNLVGGFEYALRLVKDIIEREGALVRKSGAVRMGTVMNIPLPDHSTPLVITDPPYYDAVPYADLSDFCYVWLKRILWDIHPELFKDNLTPKQDEIVKNPAVGKDDTFFESGMERALAECKRILSPDGVAVVLFAHKGTAGWEALLKALIKAGWTITASWPIETERGARMRAKDSAVLASSVFLVCRPRPEDSEIGDWREVSAELRPRIQEWLPRLAQEKIEGADAIFSCIGPALEIYSRYKEVETASGERKSLKEYLERVWEEVAREALGVVFEGSRGEIFEEDARLVVMWLWTLKSQGGEVGYTLPYDQGRLLIQAVGAKEEELKKPGSILEVKSGKARLRLVRERRNYLLERKEGLKIGISPGTTTLDRLHQAILLHAEDRGGELRRFLLDEGVGHDERLWRLANALAALYPPQSDEKRWVDGLIHRKKALGL